MASLLERPPGAQCPLESSPGCLDYALRDTRRLCHFSRPPHRLSLAYRVRRNRRRSFSSSLACFPGESCSLALYSSLPSLLLYEIHLAHSAEREQGVFKPHAGPSPCSPHLVAQPVGKSTGASCQADSRSMGLEYPARIGTCAASHAYAHDGICSGIGE